MQNLGHKRFCFANLKDASKGAEKNFARVLFCFIGVRDTAPTTNTLNTAPAT